MKKTNPEMNRTDSSNTFYSARGVTLLISVVLLLAVLALFGMYSLGVIRLPAALTRLLGSAETTAHSTDAPVIGEETAEPTLVPAMSREEYAAAMADMRIPASYYRAYKISIYGGNASVETDYTVVVRDADWWVREERDGIILSTAVCKDGRVRITDNTQDSTVQAAAATPDTPSGIRLSERMGTLTVADLAQMIGTLGSGDAVVYGGGLTGYSLALTPARGAGENVFTFDFTTASGMREVYSFSFESAVLLTAEKYSGDRLVYKLESTAYTNDLSGMRVDDLFE